jgi:AcrR family transcriptional regulator
MSVLKRSRRRARRRTYLPADERRRQILEVAKGVFAQRGYQTANVAHICAAARIGRGTLYQYFDNKRGVLLALLEEVCERVRDVLAARPRLAGMPGLHRASHDVVVSFSKQGLHQVLDVIFSDEPMLRLIFRSRGLDRDIDRMIATIDGYVLAAMEEDLAAAQDAGLLRTGDRKLIARFVLGGLEKVLLDALVKDEPIDRVAIVDTAIELELFGILSEEVRR